MKKKWNEHTSQLDKRLLSKDQRSVLALAVTAHGKPYRVPLQIPILIRTCLIEVMSWIPFRALSVFHTGCIRLKFTAWSMEHVGGDCSKKFGILIFIRDFGADYLIDLSVGARFVVGM